MTNRKFTVSSILGGMLVIGLLLSLLSGVGLLAYFAGSSINSAFNLDMSASGFVNWLNQPMSNIILTDPNVPINETNSTESQFVVATNTTTLNNTNSTEYQHIANSSLKTNNTNLTEHVNISTLLTNSTGSLDTATFVFLSFLLAMMMFMIFFFAIVNR